MGTLRKELTAFIDNEGGITAIEYGLMGGLIAAALVVAVAYVASALDTNLESVANTFPASS